MGVLQAGVVQAVKVAGVAALSAERAAYHGALVALAGKDLGLDVRGWRAIRPRSGVVAAPPRKPVPAPKPTP